MPHHRAKMTLITFRLFCASLLFVTFVHAYDSASGASGTDCPACDTAQRKAREGLVCKTGESLACIPNQAHFENRIHNITAQAVRLATALAGTAASGSASTGCQCYKHHKQSTCPSGAGQSCTWHSMNMHHNVDDMDQGHCFEKFAAQEKAASCAGLSYHKGMCEGVVKEYKCKWDANAGPTAAGASAPVGRCYYSGESEDCKAPS